MRRVTQNLPAPCLRARAILDFGLLSPTIMFRRSILEQLDSWYEDRFRRCEDGDFMLRLALVAPFAQIRATSFHYSLRNRDAGGVVSRGEIEYQCAAARRRIEHFLGPGASITEAEYSAATLLSARGWRPLAKVPLADVVDLAERLIRRATELDFAPPAAVAGSIGDLMFYRVRRHKQPEWFAALYDLVRRHRVPRAWMPRVTLKRWWIARLRTTRARAALHPQSAYPTVR
jgi:hypothetical protein